VSWIDLAVGSAACDHATMSRYDVIVVGVGAMGAAACAHAARRGASALGLERHIENLEPNL
jgi:flavin-dependent dehydrogenase